MAKFNDFLQEKITPAMNKFGNNIVLSAITRGVMASLPLTLGTFLIAIVANFPVKAWTNWLAAIGLDTHLNAVVGATTDMLALFFAFTIAYNYAKLKESDELIAGVLSLASFIIVMPQQINGADGNLIAALEKTYLGSSGIFVAMLTAVLVGALYSFLDKKGLVIKLPDSVPEMVSKSLGPVFIAMIIFVVVLFVRIGFAYTSFNTIFEFINTVVGKPVMHLGSSTIALLIFFTIANILWWCGIHPASLQGVYMPVAMGAIAANVAAFQQGDPLPYTAFMVLFFTYVGVGGNGNTLGLAINMAIFSKSERYKVLGRISLVPNIFNINEPLIFGTPMIFNPFFFVPMALSSIVTGLVGLVFVKIGAYNSFNPLILLPWTTPPAVTAVITAGFLAAVGVICAIFASVLLYFPFFKMADKQALKEEQEK
ncbi:PTS sugar transporter subunit IIC [Vallitalea maricola]|uniref:PTS sugar transporter subunit IIC n=1 Tax=Vallitalea maricola TaxID=3074433 RepID=A0ACB5UHS2_9FIRM|nr:PTS sugar transporter subunit IIC [Vallitalea sp. AN17-2]